MEARTGIRKMKIWKLRNNDDDDDDVEGYGKRKERK